MTAGEAEPGATLEKGEREVQEESILTAEFYTPTWKAGSDWKCGWVANTLGVAPKEGGHEI